MTEVVRIPVRHHSPACARLVRHVVATRRPSRILIEGPSDFEPLEELLLPHQPPVAIYSYFRAEEMRTGAYYPFCAYSPEWVAIRCAGELRIPFEFIDLPWATMHALDPEGAVRYADGSLRRSRLLDALCADLGVERFDDAWDLLFEVDEGLAPEVLFERLALFCEALRRADEEHGVVRESDLAREAYMRRRIAAAVARSTPGDGPILVITGGYHTSALVPRDEPELELPTPPDGERGIALTPYSFERLDAHTGYASGMPSPGFYQALWDGIEPLPLAVRALRDRKQEVSTADLITAEALARGLAALRGHPRVFRRDVLDAARSAFVKDSLEGDSHPVLATILRAFRGGERGRLAAGTRRPPLAVAIEAALADAGLVPDARARSETFLLREETDRARSRLLHRLATLGIRGFHRTRGTDFLEREDLSEPFETWELVWTPELESDCIEASVYGSTLLEAVAARLLAQASEIDRDAARAARLAVEASLAGVDSLTLELAARLRAALVTESEFVRIAEALGHLLYLHRFDEALGTRGSATYLALLEDAYDRGLWLLSVLADGSPPVLDGVARMLGTRRRCAETLAVEPLRDVLLSIASDDARAPSLRGAATGGLFSLGTLAGLGVADRVRDFARPEELGDFLVGVFTVAREAIRNEPALMVRLDEVLMSFSDEEFLEALPPLRLAFSFFPPREKHHLMAGLVAVHGDTSGPLPGLAVSAETAARAMAIEASVLGQIERHGIRSPAGRGGAS